MDWWSRHWNTFAEASYSKSYWVQDNCGPRSKYACPDSRLPMQISPDNMYVGPDGKVVPPVGGFPIQTPTAPDSAKVNGTEVQRASDGPSSTVNNIALAVLCTVTALGAFYIRTPSRGGATESLRRSSPMPTTRAP